MYAPLIVIFMIIIIYLLFKSYKEQQKLSSCEHGCKCSDCVNDEKFSNMPDIRMPSEKKRSLLDSLCDENSAYCIDHDVQPQGLNDIEQTPQSRGYVPYSNQPDHISNLWKSDSSQQTSSKYQEHYLGEYFGNNPNDNRDDLTRFSKKVKNVNVSGNSASHKISRYASDTSQKAVSDFLSN